MNDRKWQVSIREQGNGTGNNWSGNSKVNVGDWLQMYSLPGGMNSIRGLHRSNSRLYGNPRIWVLSDPGRAGKNYD